MHYKAIKEAEMNLYSTIDRHIEIRHNQIKEEIYKKQ